MMLIIAITEPIVRGQIMMEDTIKLSTNDPTKHVNEEIRNDFSDVMNGFTFMFGFMFIVFFAMVIIKFLAS